MLGAGSVPARAHPSLFVAVPTTAGTGSEVSDSAIVYVPRTIYKAVMRAPHLAPAVALLDPELGVTAPAEVTATAGYDAMTHAVEAYVSRAATPLMDPLALTAIAALARHLPVAFARPDDIVARGACLIASTQAGIAFNSAHLGMAHAVAGSLGALHHVPHGLTNALALPMTMTMTMAFCAPSLVDKAPSLAAALGAPSVAGGLARLRHGLGLDRGLDAYVPDAGARDRLAKAAMTSGQIAMSPRRPTPAQMRSLIEAMRVPGGREAPELSEI
ncbi:MAG: iron-containing alcohol dehydrogenase family protein [Roseicyclus sp.]